MHARGHFLIDPENEPYALGLSPRLPAGKLGCFTLFLGLFVGAGLLLGGALAREWVHFAILSASEAETQGQVLQREIDIDDSTTYYVTYRFIVNDREHTVEESVGKDTYQSVEEGQHLRIRYSELDPNIATIEPGRIGVLPVVTVFCLIWNGVVFVITLGTLREVRKRRRLGKVGQRITGEVVRCSGEVDGDGDYVLTVGFRFNSPQTGQWIQGRDSQIRNDLKGEAPPPPGTSVHVLYLDDGTYMIL